LNPGQAATVVAVRATSTEVFKYVAQRGLLPGHSLRVVEIAPLQGPMLVTVNGVEAALGFRLAEFILVQPTSECEVV
jgi:Fe2+ transport system protein FeoA